jgi:threonine aldolase
LKNCCDGLPDRAQLIAYVEDRLFLRLASHANELASQLDRELAAIPGVR